MKIDLNPLDVLNKRRVKFMPVQFSSTVVKDNFLYEHDILKWIEIKLKDRFYFKTIVEINDKNRTSNNIHVGFENHKEMTYFLLACPHLRRN